VEVLRAGPMAIVAEHRIPIMVEVFEQGIIYRKSCQGDEPCPMPSLTAMTPVKIRIDCDVNVPLAFHHKCEGYRVPHFSEARVVVSPRRIPLTEPS
jgi:hypothetical protein